MPLERDDHHHLAYCGCPTKGPRPARACLYSCIARGPRSITSSRHVSIIPKFSWIHVGLLPPLLLDDFLLPLLLLLLLLLLVLLPTHTPSGMSGLRPSKQGESGPPSDTSYPASHASHTSATSARQSEVGYMSASNVMTHERLSM